MSRTYLVQLPRTEARHLAGAGQRWPAAPEARCVQAVREWLHGLQRRRSAAVPVSKVVADLTAILGMAPENGRPARGPFGPGGGGAPLPGRADYLGCGIVRLDDTAISALDGLAEGDDFRVSFTDVGPVLEVGAGRYPARPEEPEAERRPARLPPAQPSG